MFSTAERTFEITPKTPWKGVIKDWTRTIVYDPKPVTGDIIKNAQELESGVEWPFVLQQVRCRSFGENYTGRAAVYNSIALGVACVAYHMEWDMHAPGVVYFSGYHFRWSLGKEVGKVQKLIDENEEGRRQFTTDEAKEEAMVRDKEKLGKLLAYESRIGNSTDAYAKLHLPEGEEYQGVLRTLFYANHISMPYKIRKEVMSALKAEDLKRAVALSGSFTRETRDHLGPARETFEG